RDRGGDGADDTEVGLLGDTVLLEQDGVATHVAHREVERHHESVLLHIERLIVGDAPDAVSRHFTVENGVSIGWPHDPQAPIGRKGLHDGARHDGIDARLGGAVPENRHTDRADVPWQRAAERVAAAGERHRHQRERDDTERAPHARVTMLTRRLATTTTRSTARSRTHGCTRSSARARRWIRSFGVPTSTWRRLRTLPSTCTTSVTSFFTSAAASASGQGCVKRLSV